MNPTMLVVMVLGASSLTGLVPFANAGDCEVNDVHCCKANGEDGAEASCSFECQYNSVHVELDTSDSDAEIKKAEAKCSDTYKASCTGANYCHGSSENRWTGTGSCSANVDEWWDDPYWIRCWSLGPPADSPAEDTAEDNQGAVCDQQGAVPALDQVGLGLGWCWMTVGDCVVHGCTASTESSMVIMQVVGGVAEAYVCKGGACAPVAPNVRANLDGSLTVWVGPEP